MAKYATNVSGAILLPSSIQVTESISGSVVPLAMFYSTFQVLFAIVKEHNISSVEELLRKPGETLIYNLA